MKAESKPRDQRTLLLKGQQFSSSWAKQPITMAVQADEFFNCGDHRTVSAPASRNFVSNLVFLLPGLYEPIPVILNIFPCSALYLMKMMRYNPR
jgi:hypothetical protein